MRLSGRRNPRTNLQGNAGGVIGGRGSGGGGGGAVEGETWLCACMCESEERRRTVCCTLAICL